MSATIKSSIRRHFSKSRGREITDITPGVGRSNDKEPLSFVIRHPTVCRQYRPTTGHRHLRTCIYLGINLCPSVSKIQRIRFSLSKILGKDTRALVRSFSPLILSLSLSAPRIHFFAPSILFSARACPSFSLAALSSTFEDRPKAVLLETIYFSFHSSRRR